MWNLRSNAEVLDDTWWNNGGNALWARYATTTNVNRETMTLFLTDGEWEEFEKAAKKLPGWKGIEPYPVDNPLWVVKQQTVLHICDDPWIWLQATIGEARRRAYGLWLDGTDRQREAMTEICHTTLSEVIKEETRRWELFGIVPRLQKRMLGIERCTPEWTGEYTKQFIHCYRSICFKAKKDFTNRFYVLFEPRILSYLSRNDPDPESGEEHPDFAPSAYLFPDDDEFNDDKEEQEADSLAEEDDEDDEDTGDNENDRNYEDEKDKPA